MCTTPPPSLRDFDRGFGSAVPTRRRDGRRTTTAVTFYARALRIAAEPCGALPNRGAAKVLHLRRAAVECGAGATGLEPATSGVTGRRSNQLSYAPRA